MARHKPIEIRDQSNGKGFYMMTARRKPVSADIWRHILAGGCFALTLTAVTVVMIGQKASPDFITLTLSLLTLCGLVAYDIFSRRLWENKTASHIRDLIRNHDRLVREAARNRTDIAIMKEGITKTVMAVEEQARNLPPGASVEAKMIEAMIDQLGILGERPRAAAGSSFDREILEMEMTPPPQRPEPLTDIDDELRVNLDQMDDETMTALIKDAVRNDRIDVFMQPVVALPQRRVKMMEVFARIRAGSGVYLPANRYLPLARREKLVSAIDNLLLLRCLQMLRDDYTNSNVAYVLNISATTMNDRAFMGDLVSFLSQNKALAPRLVFEIAQRELTLLDDSLVQVLNGLAQLGCRFSMDRVRDRMIDIDIMKSRNVRFVKIDALWLLKEASTQTGFSRIVRLKKQLDAAGIDLIVEKIEDEHTLRELLDFNIDFGQGYLFGKPDHQVAFKASAAA